MVAASPSEIRNENLNRLVVTLELPKEGLLECRPDVFSKKSSSGIDFSMKICYTLLCRSRFLKVERIRNNVGSSAMGHFEMERLCKR